MRSPQPCFSPFIPNQTEQNNKQLLLLFMFIGYVNYYINWLNEAIWKLRRAIKDLLLRDLRDFKKHVWVYKLLKNIQKLLDI